MMMLLVYRPHHKLTHNFIYTITEILFVGIHSLILVLGYDDIDSSFTIEVRERIGDMIIGLCLMALSIEFMILIKEQIEAFYNIYKVIKNWVIKIHQMASGTQKEALESTKLTRRVMRPKRKKAS